MAVLFLGRKQYFHHIVGIFLIVGGVGLVSFAGMYTKHEDSAHPEHEAVASATLFGVLMILLAQCFNASQHIVEEKLLQGDHLDPMLVVGIEGLCGCIFFAILLPIF
jgi:drug/metabolite transporter (DMT)-like permease